jgi:nicotinate dehydrogenase subunit A
VPSPSEREIREALKYNLCRCGAHEEILQSVREALALALALARAGQPV